MKIVIAGALIAAGLVAGCTMEEGAATASSEAPARSATLLDATGKQVATASIMQQGSGIRVRIDATAVPAGVHAAHIHMVGSCTPPGFESAGSHWNPGRMQHGKDNPAGMHKGDLPNVTIAADGTGSVDYVVDGAMITGGEGALLDADGAAVVIHANPDDYRTDPTGNAGGRIACGVIG